MRARAVARLPLLLSDADASSLLGAYALVVQACRYRLSDCSVNACFVAWYLVHLICHPLNMFLAMLHHYAHSVCSTSNSVAREGHLLYRSTHMYSLVSLLAIVIVCYTTYTLALPAPADLTRPVSFLSSNLTTLPALPTIKLQNTTLNPPNFLGVECYHLVPNTVDLEDCQPLFASLVQSGDVYKERNWWNGWHFRRGVDPCTITLSSPDRKDRRVSISVADMVVFATDVLRTCRETGTGGANTFRGTWRVVITRVPLEAAALDRVLLEW